MSNLNSSNRLNIASQRMLSYLSSHPKELESGLITSDLFLNDNFKVLFQAMEDLYNEGQPITSLTLTQRVSDSIPEYNVDTIEAILNTQDETLAIDDALKDIKKANNQHKAASTAFELYEKLNNLNCNDDDITLNLFNLTEELEYIKNNKEYKFDSVIEWAQKYEDNYSSRKDKKQYPFGDVFLDKNILRGAAPGTIGVVAAATGMGKSTFVGKLARNFESAEVPCLLLSLEMSGESQFDRRLSAKHRIAFQDVINPQDPTIYNNVIRAVEEEKLEATHSTLAFSDLPRWDMLSLKKAIIDFKNTQRTDYAVVIIDLLTMLDEFCKVRNGLNFAQSIEISMNMLNALAKELNIHIIGTVQFGRSADKVKIKSVEDVENCRPSLNDLKNSNAIAERSRYVIGLFRRKHYLNIWLPEDEDVKGMDDIIECLLMKQNDGPLAVGKYLFDPTYMDCYYVNNEFNNEEV